VKTKLNFQHHYSSSVSHGPSEIILICWIGARNIFYYYQWWKQL